MTDVFRPMKINVPGLLSDDALREQLKRFANEKNIEQAAAPLPSGAVEMADKVQNDFLSQPGSVLSLTAAVAPTPLSPLLQTAAAGMRDAPTRQRDPVLAAQNTAIDVRSDILAGAVDKLTPDFISELGNMTDPERQAEADAKLKAAEARAGGGLEADLAETQRKRDAAIASGRDPDSLDFMRDPETIAADRAKENAAFDRDMRDSAAKNLTVAKAQAANKELQPTQTWWMNAIQKGVASGYMTLTGALGGVVGGYELTAGRLFNGGDIRRSDMRAWINTVEATVNKTIPGDPLRAQEFLTQLAEGGGSFASYALGGLALRAAGIPAAASTAGIGFFSGANTGLVDAERFNAVGVQKYMAYLLNGALGITEAWPINRMFMRAEAATGGLVSRLLNQTAAEGLEEFVQELGQSVGQDVVAKWVYDAKREFDASKYVKQAAIGAVTGGVAGGAAAVLNTSPAANPALRIDPKLKAGLDALTPDKQTSLIDNTIAAAQAQLDAIVPDAPTAEQAAVAPATTVFEGPGGAIPVRADGMMELSHWSSAPRDVIDPAMRGTGPLRGQEQNRIGRKSYGDDPSTDIVDRSYYGVGDPFFAEKFAAEQAGLPAKERRRLASTDPYHREGLGGVRHTVAVDPATIYNWYDDPLNLRAKLDKTTPASEQVTRYERLIKDAGFKGAYFSESDLGQTAILFDKAIPEKVTDDYYGMDPKEIATPEDFKQLKPETFAKGGWAVITGIQEAQGEHNSSANIEANKKLENVLRRNGIKYQVVSGAYKGVDQGKSFLIFAPEKVAKQLGERFKQESILTRKGLEYTDGRVTPVDPAGTIIGPEAAKQDFYSTLPDGTPFTLGLDFDATTNPAELQSMYGMRAAQADVETFSLEDTFDMGLADKPGNTDPYAGFSADDIAFMESGGLFASRVAPVGDVTQTPEFKAWFGDSKVVDESGKPLVVYHGTPAGRSFTVFRENAGDANTYKEATGEEYKKATTPMGFYFAEAKSFAKQFKRGVKGGAILDVYLSIRNPLVVKRGNAASMRAVETVRARAALAEGYEVSADEASEYVDTLTFWQLLDKENGGEAFLRAARALGYDGISARELYEDEREDRNGNPLSEPVWVAFEPSQIKSVNNAGAFDPANPDIYAMASPRAAYKGELQRPKKGVPMQPGDEGIDAAEAGIAKVGQNFVKLLGLTTRLGRFTLKGSDVMGQFSTKQAVVRLRSNKDVSALVHEGGHAMQAAAAPPLADFIKRNTNTLMKAAADMYGGDLSKADNKTKIAEGFAEFFRVYTLGRAYAVRKYPALTADFTATLGGYAPELKTGLEAIGTQFEAWTLKLPSAKVLESMVVTGRVDTGLNAALADLREAGFGTWMQEVTRNAVENSVNRNAGLNSLVARMLNLAEDNKGAALDLKRANDPRVLVRLAGNAGARAMVQTTDGVMPYRSVEAKTRGLREALALSQGYGADANVGKIDPVRQKAFAAYVVSLRGIDEFRRKAEGKIRNNPLGDSVTLAELQQTVKDYEAAYGTDFTEAAAIMHEYGMALWQKAYDAGLMSKDAYLAGQDRQFYVPLQRDMTDLQANPGLGGVRADGGRSIVKAFKGSGRDVIDPMDVLMHKTFSLEQAIAKNDIVKALASLADRTGQAGALVERIPASHMVAKGYSVEEIAKALTKDKDLSADDAQDLMDLLDASIAENNMLNLFRAEQAKTKGENILFFWEKGTVAAIQLVDGDLGADVVNLMNGVGPENFHFLVELVSSISGAFRSSITVWPDFLAVNFIRDQWNAYSLTDVGYIPFVTGLRGVGDELRQRSWAKQYNAAMGVMGGMNVASMHNAAVSRDINALRKRGYIAKAFNEGGFAGAAKGMASMVELTETGTRLGVFRKAFGRAKKDGLTDWEASIEASYLATDMMDFGLNGSRMALFRRTIPFLNAQVQGLYKLVRTLGGDEVRQRKGLAFVLKAYTKSVNNLDLSRAEKQAVNTGRKAWVKMASLAVLSAALHFIFEDDPDYQDASEYLRATGWVIPMGDGRVFYIPKPFELALLANFTERALESASGDTGAKARFLRGLAMNMVPPTSPPAIKVAVEEIMNKDSFAGRAIVPTDEVGMPPQMQYDEYTTDLAKRIGEATGLSPRRVDHVMSGLGASAYRDVSSMVNSLNPNRPTKDADEMPFFRRFVRDARRGSATSRDFWKEAALTAGVYDGAANAYQKLLQGSPEGRAANEFLGTLDEDLKAYAVLDNHFPAGVKRFHPYYRGRQVAYIVSAMRRELISDIGLEDTTTKAGEPILLTASLKAKVDDELSEYVRREMRNAMVSMKATGWADKEPMDLQGTIDMLEALDPRVSDELLRRMKAEKVVPSEMAQEYWPEIKNRLLTDGADANFVDVLTIAKAMQ